MRLISHDNGAIPGKYLWSKTRHTKYLLKNIFYKSLMFTEKGVFNCQVIFSKKIHKLKPWQEKFSDNAIHDLEKLKTLCLRSNVDCI